MTNSISLFRHSAKRTEQDSVLHSTVQVYSPLISEEPQDSAAKIAERDALYQEFAPLVRRLLRQYGQDPEFKKDLAGEIYCCFCSLLDAYDPTRGIPLRPYLVRQLSAAIYTLARQQWRRQRRELVTSPQTPPRLLPDPTRQWDQQLLLAQVAAALPAALAQLSVRQRQVVLWRYYQGRSFEEIAAVLGVEVATARSLLRHGLNKLRSLIGKDYYQDGREL